MISAVNGGLLFLNACWYNKSVEYGFQFSEPKELAKFFDVFCFREHWWHFKIEDGPGRLLGRSFGVKLWPTLIFLDNGKEVSRLVRPRDAKSIRDELARIDAR